MSETTSEITPEIAAKINPGKTQELTHNFKFFSDKKLRKVQQIGIEFALESEKKIIAIEAPTGTGKTGIGAVLCSEFDYGIYVVHSKSLQEQLHYDFPEIPVLKGRNNYKCGYDPTINANECNPTQDAPCNSMCEYKRQKDLCLESDIKCLNYPYILTELNLAGAAFGGHDIIICDEADVIEKTLSGFITLRLTDTMLSKYILELPIYKTVDKDHKLNDWKDWAERCISKLKVYKSNINKEINKFYDSNDFLPDDQCKELKKVESLLTQFYLFKDSVDENWMFEQKENTNKRTGHKYNSFEWSPLWLTEDLAYEYFWKYCNKFVLMSATLPEPETLCRQLGIPMADLDYIKIPSSYSPDNCPIVFTDSWTGTRDVFDTDNMIDEISRILNIESDWKGIIHSVSYKIRDFIMDHCQQIWMDEDDKQHDRLITHNTGNREEILQQFLDSDRPLVLVSPSMERGVSFPYNHCRFSILAKTPYESLGDKKVSKRLYDKKMNGQGWYRNVTAQSIIQGTGRGVRADDDYCKNYFIDKNTKKFVFDNLGLFNEYFKNCIKLDGE